MDYVLLAVGAAVAISLGAYLIRQCWQGRACDDVQHVVSGRQAQAGFQRSRLFEEGCAVPVDFEKYRVSQILK